MTLDTVDFVAVFAALGIVGAIAALASWKVAQKFAVAQRAQLGLALEVKSSEQAQKAHSESLYFASQLEQLRVLIASRSPDALHPALLGLLATQRQGGCCSSRSGLTIVELRDGLADLVKVNEALASVNGPDGWQRLQGLLSSDAMKSVFQVLAAIASSRGSGLGLPLPPGFAPGPCPGCGKPPAVPVPPGAVVAQSIEEAKRLHEQMQAAAAKATESLPPTPPIVEAPPSAPIVAEPPKLDTGGASGVGSAASGVPSTATNGPQPA